MTTPIPDDDYANAREFTIASWDPRIGHLSLMCLWGGWNVWMEACACAFRGHPVKITYRGGEAVIFPSGKGLPTSQ